jgi:hypothetical protein
MLRHAKKVDEGKEKAVRACGAAAGGGKACGDG